MVSGITSVYRNAFRGVWTNAPSARDIFRNINNIALPAIALVAATNLQGADGGPILYGLCVASCEAAAAAGTLGAGAAAALVFCIEGCWPALAAGPF